MPDTATNSPNSIFAKIQQQMANHPRQPPEDSLLLRVLVQAMVVVGIVATDVAAETQMSWWAIPLSIAGATWSWYHRRDRNIGVKFMLAIAMLAALGYFVSHLIGAANDTRLILAELLVQIQTVHTFDLPRRKDLGYSMTIGLILISVAGTLSQTLAFAPLLLLFLALAIPVLFLDYRARLDLAPVGVKSVKQLDRAGLSWRQWLQLFAAIISIGLAIFALMPRFPSYQGVLPMSAPVQYEPKSFDGKGISNPGYQRQGKSGNGKGRQIDDAQGGDGDRTLDENFYYGFNSQIDQNLRGVMKPKQVMRVRAQAPGFWRALAFDRYTGKGWEISRNEQTDKIKRPAWEYKFAVGYPNTKIPVKQIIQSYTALEELPNIIPGMYHASELYFPTQEVALDKEGSLRSPVGLTPGLTYTVVSHVPYRDRELLDKASTDYPAQISKYYLQIPANIAPKLRKFTQDLIDNSTNQQVGKNSEPLQSNYAKALYLAQYLKQHYRTPTDPLGLEQMPAGSDLASWFLFRCEGKSTSCQAGGYADHFATTYTMMLRSIGIPARLAVGFEPGNFNPFTGFYEVSNTDAHALTEVYFPDYGWYAFDPIPGHALTPPGADEDYTLSAIGQIWKWVAGWLPSPVTGWLSFAWALVIGTLGVAIGWFLGLFAQGWLGIFLGCGIATTVAFVLWWSTQQWGKWRHRQWLKRLAPVERIYQQMLALLRDRGSHKQPSQTPLEYARSLENTRFTALDRFVTEISQAYSAWRYGQLPQRLDRLQELLTSLKGEKKSS